MSDRSIITAVQKMAGVFKTDKSYYIVASVKSVEDNTCTVTFVSGENESEVSGVLLQAEVCDGLLIKPKVGSNVLVCLSIYNPPYIAMFSDIDEFYLQVGDSALTITNDGKIKLNDGSFDGLIKISDLTTKLNNMVTAINVELGKIQAGIIAAGGSYTPTNLNDFNKSDYENTKVLHGK